MSKLPDTSIRIGKRAFILAFAIILLLMIVAGILTRVVPAGSYARIQQDGREIVQPGTYHQVEVADVPVYRWFTAPVEVLFAPGNITVITIVLFLFFVGGAFAILEAAGVLESLLETIVQWFDTRRYLLMGVIIFFFMFVAAALGIYESMVPMIIFIVPLALRLGWDSLTGLGLSLLPLAFGFSSAFTNPFTVGVAQRLSQLPLFSGLPMRLVFFGLTFLSVFLFVRHHARRVEQRPEASPVFEFDEKLRERLFDPRVAEKPDQATVVAGRMRAAILWFVVSMGVALLYVFATARDPALSNLAFPIMALLFLIGGIGAGLIARPSDRSPGKQVAFVTRVFGRGTLNMLPAVLLILMSLSVKHIVTEGGIMDTMLHSAVAFISGTSRFASALLIYVFTLIMNFFIGSASAKAFLMMPMLSPLADLVHITRQTAVLAFTFGDGFSNMIYPTNALLIIALGFTVVSYPTWIRWTLLLQGLMVVLSIAFLAIAVAIGYGPF